MMGPYSSPCGPTSLLSTSSCHSFCRTPLSVRSLPQQGWSCQWKNWAWEFRQNKWLSIAMGQSTLDKHAGVSTPEEVNGRLLSARGLYCFSSCACTLGFLSPVHSFHSQENDGGSTESFCSYSELYEISSWPLLFVDGEEGFVFQELPSKPPFSPAVEVQDPRCLSFSHLCSSCGAWWQALAGILKKKTNFAW